MRLEHGQLTAYDQDGDPTATADPDLPVGARLLAATADLGRAAAADAGQLWLRTADDSRRIPLAADAVGLLQGGMIIATAPVFERGATWSTAHRIVLLDRGGAVLDDHLVPDACGAVAAVTVHPGLTQAVIEFAMGQDGTIAQGVQLRPSGLGPLGLDVRELLAGEDPVVGGFSPSGDAVLLLPHPNDPSTATVLAWPDLHPLGRYDCADDPSIEHGIGFTGGFLDEEHVILYAVEQGILIASRELSRVEHVVLEPPLDRHADLEWLAPLGADRFVTGVWAHGGERRAPIWQLHRD